MYLVFPMFSLNQYAYKYLMTAEVKLKIKIPRERLTPLRKECETE